MTKEEEFNYWANRKFNEMLIKELIKEHPNYAHYHRLNFIKENGVSPSFDQLVEHIYQNFYL